MILRGYVLPHPPIILPEVGRGEEKKIEKTANSFKKVAEEIAKLKPEVIIISSPHAPAYRDGFFIGGGQSAEGDLSDFGIGGVEESVIYDEELVLKIKDNFYSAPMASPVEESRELDHGSLIPIRFINEKYRDYKIVRLGISALPAEVHCDLGKAVKKSVDELNRRVVYIASGDLSHVLKEDGPYGYRAEGPLFDEKIIETLEKADFKSLIEFPENLIEKAAQCGIKSFDIMAGIFDRVKVKAEKLSYEGPFGVGYGAFSFTPQEDIYVKLARDTIESYVRGDRESLEKIYEEMPEELRAKRAGVFVSIHENSELRGCIGTIAPTSDCVGEEVMHNAISSSTEDPRFYPVREEELENLKISVDVLGEAEKIDDISMLDVKKYGVIVTYGRKRGLLLPDLEGVDDVETQVSIALRKAGISKEENYSLERFEVVRHE